MTDFQNAKELVRKFHSAMDQASAGSLLTELSPFIAPDFFWRGMEPFNELGGIEGACDQFYEPLRASFGHWQRRPDIFMAGENKVDIAKGKPAGIWVVEMGHLVGLFDQPWLGINPSRKPTFIRYAEFCRIVDGKIAEITLFFDVIAIMRQSGFDLVPNQTGAAINDPGPMTHDGLLYCAQDPGEGDKTFQLFDTMIEELCETDVQSEVDHLEKYWTKDMMWYGPAGIGLAGCSLEGYRRCHAGPFADELEYLRHYGHVMRMGEGGGGEGGRLVRGMSAGRSRAGGG